MEVEAASERWEREILAASEDSNAPNEALRRRRCRARRTAFLTHPCFTAKRTAFQQRSAPPLGRAGYPSPAARAPPER
eukprot:10601865-Alexandrium_andersonii.AAC.1